MLAISAPASDLPKVGDGWKTEVEEAATNRHARRVKQDALKIFTSSSRLPYWVGGVVLIAAIGAEALGVLSAPIATCLAMPGVLLWLDASIGTQVLRYYFFAKHTFTQERVQDLYFAQPAALPRYAAAAAFSATFALIVTTLKTELVTVVGLVFCVVAYSLLAGVSLLRFILQAGQETQRPNVT